MQTNPNTTPAPSTIRHLSGVTELTHWGVIRAVGADAASFLQGQLTQDVAQMGLADARLAAFCNNKGRMQASFIVVKRSPDEFMLVCSRDILAATLKRLSMFVMRAKAVLTDATEDFSLFGMAGYAIENIATDVQKIHAAATFDDISVVSLYPGAGVARALRIAPTAAAAPEGETLGAGLWAWLEVQSGVAMISQPIFEAFVPQMLNYESVGGVNFKKGCYPGQEIVARSQFRGTLKRRAYLLHAEITEAKVGQEVFHASDAEQPCGLVAAWGANPNGGVDMIISMQTSAAADADDAKLTLGSPEGAALHLRSLPYALLEDI